MKKIATKNNNFPIIMTTIMVIALASYFLAVKKVRNNYLPSLDESTKIEKSSDLNQASDELESVNVDAVDMGLNELKVEVSTY